MHVSISREHLSLLQGHAGSAHPKECCGLLFGEGGWLDEVRLTENRADAPESEFEIDPAALIVAQKEERSGGGKLLGYFHSHPNGLARPSQTDADMAAADGKIWLILAGEDVTAWHAVPNGALFRRFDPLRLDIRG